MKVIIAKIFCFLTVLLMSSNLVFSSISESNSNATIQLKKKTKEELQFSDALSIPIVSFVLEKDPYEESDFFEDLSFDFTFSKKEMEPYEYQNYILKVSGDEDFRQLSGVAHFIENKQGLDTDYGKLQTTIMLISSTREELEKDLKASFEQFNSLGFVVIREDIFLEHCFWSQLPGNFHYLRRQKVINTNRIAGFAALHNFPSGLIAGNKWGPAATVFRTVLNTPYFFNFHDGDLGHSLIMGPENSGKTVLLNFLVTQSRRFSRS